MSQPEQRSRIVTLNLNGEPFAVVRKRRDTRDNATWQYEIDDIAYASDADLEDALSACKCLETMFIQQLNQERNQR